MVISKFSSSKSNESGGLDPVIEKHLAKSQRALQLLRRRIATVWLALAVLVGVGLLLFSAIDWITEDGFIICHFVLECLFQVLVFISLAPLADDEFFCRCALTVDVFVLCFAKMNDWSRIAAHFRDLSLSHVNMGPMQGLTFLVILDVIRCTCFLLCVLWVMSSASAGKVQQRTWAILRLQAFLACVHGIVCILPGVVHSRDSQHVCCVLGGLILLVIVSCPQWQQGVQQRMLAWMTRRAANQGAASIACLIGPCRPGEAICQAKQRFRCISVDQLDESVLADNCPNSAHGALAVPCSLGRCDAFLSHSWQDDGNAKWRALQRWREAFVAEHGREPLIWFDKCCIDQGNINLDLRCLPIFLKGCSSLVVLCGPTYLGRLWCILEIFTYVHMGGSIDDIKIVPVLRDSCELEDDEAIAASFDTFDARECKCSCPEDKQRMLAVFEAAYGSMQAFNAVVKAITGQIGRSRSREFIP